ncbi:double-strand break repair protein AddB [Oceaniglobus indicus]|uniref:double-strand break repair protein AddB n=1 Tax=Oceaniglobus indicus TaxID=2047749 RepID=UPI000C175A64|nr:double-strand break repair protein AddB [Oceaniglobus indicus]
MFEPSDDPRVFALPPGADFPAELCAGLIARCGTGDPAALARVQVFVNTARMARRIKAIFAEHHTLLLPRIRLVTDLDIFADTVATEPPLPPLRRRLELAKLIAGLLERDRTLAPRAATFDLADSLTDLFDEMQVEGVSPDALAGLDVTDQSGHWARSLSFVRIVADYLARDTAQTPAARARAATEALVARWQTEPPDTPIIVAGSTGSRGTTALFMEAVARLPQGAVILPGFDFDQPAHVWDRLDDALTSEDHPQYRFARMVQALSLTPDRVQRWTAADPARGRNTVMSLALRPAPVTDQWMREGPDLGDLVPLTREITLIEADSPRHEALAIALRLRQAAEDGQTAALITPDRMLTRQVTAALDRWSLIPDDSAGRPLALSAPGRFLRHIADLFGERLTPEALLTLLKHPITNTGSRERGPHLRLTRELELWMRRNGPPFLNADVLMAWAGGQKDTGALSWAGWLSRCLTPLGDIGSSALPDLVERLCTTAETLSRGPDPTSDGELWLKEAGAAAKAQMTALKAEADAGGTLTPGEFQRLILSILNDSEVREPVSAHPGIMIWGTLEARVQGADLVILGGLNDGTWPQTPTPDPWLNRPLRQQAGLLLPERRVGLSAHDFQQAAAAPHVVLSRARRDAEAETVPSRWVNRLTNLLNGLPGTNGPEALAAMRARGARWSDMARALDADYQPVTPARRPAPRPPRDARPKQLSVTQIKTLIRDPYAIYARHVLRLRALDPLHPEPDAPLRGTVLHEVFEHFVRDVPDPAAPDARARLLAIADETLAKGVPWPASRRIWAAKLARVIDWFLSTERDRRREATPLALEDFARFPVPGTDFTLTGKADRIDRRTDGRLVIYDYKTGTPPKAAEMTYFDKQLLLEAAMAEAGAFPRIPRATVAEVAYIGLGSTPVFDPLALRDAEAEHPLDPDRTILELRRLLDSYDRRTQGYASRRAMHKTWNDGDYDHLARFGEWDDSDPITPEDVG